MVFAAGQVATAALLNAPFPLDFAGWSSYVPTWTQSATITHTVTTAQYWKVGRLVVVNLNLAATSAGTANNPLQVTLPVNIRTGSGGAIGSFSFLDASAATSFVGIPTVTAANAVQFRVNSTTANLGQTGGGFTAAVASGDGMSITMLYESAT